MVIYQFCRLLNRNVFKKYIYHTFTKNLCRTVNYSCSNFCKLHSNITLNIVQSKRGYCSTDISSLEFTDDEINDYFNIHRKKFSNSSYDKHSEMANSMDEIEVMTTELEELREMMHDSDKEISNLAAKDVGVLKRKISQAKLQIINDLNIHFKSLEDNIENFTIEVNSGAGGQEAMLFAKELIQLYSLYCARMGWNYDMQDLSDTDIGGIRRGSLDIKGKDAYRCLRYEGGVHRVQRNPATERGGRVHTSTVSVCVLPVPTQIEINLKESDLKCEAKRASGPGGQGVNKASSCARVTHLPTGVFFESQLGRNIVTNTEDAKKKLKMKLYEDKLEIERSKYSRDRKVQVGMRGRSEKIRTYNFSQDRLTDHRINVNMHNLPDMMVGGDNFHKLVLQLMKYSQKEHIRDIILNNLCQDDCKKKKN